MAKNPYLGRKVRALRTRERLTQAALAQRLGISPSYLNLIEHDQRPVSANLLLKLAQVFDLDLRALAATEDAKLVAELSEALVDPVFEGRRLDVDCIQRRTTASSLCGPTLVDRADSSLGSAREGGTRRGGVEGQIASSSGD